MLPVGLPKSISEQAASHHAADFCGREFNVTRSVGCIADRPRHFGRNCVSFDFDSMGLGTCAPKVAISVESLPLRASQFLGATRVKYRNRHPDLFSCFAGYTVMANRQTNTLRYSVCSNRPPLSSAAMRYGLIMNKGVNKPYGFSYSNPCYYRNHCKLYC